MAAQILQFPKPAASLSLSRAARDTQAHAYRIVAQIEREIANQAYKRAQMQFAFTPLPAGAAPLPAVVEMETPATVAKRILRAIFSLAHSA